MIINFYGENYEKDMIINIYGENNEKHVIINIYGGNQLWRLVVCSKAICFWGKGKGHFEYQKAHYNVCHR